MVGGNSLVGMLFIKSQSLQEEDKKSNNRGDIREKMTNIDEKHPQIIIFVMGERLTKGVMLVKEEDPMNDVRESYMMSEICPTGGPINILRFAGKIAKNDALIPAEEDVDGGSMVQVLVVAGGALPEVIEYDGNANVLLMWKVM